MTLYINGKQIQTFGANKLVQGENRAEAVTFKLNMADASTLAFFLIWQNENGEGNSSVPLDTVRNGDDISLTWNPSRESSAIKGKLAIQIYAVEMDGEDEVRKWMTYPTFLVVSSSLVVTEASPIDPSAMDVYLARFEALYQKTLKDASEIIDEEAVAKIEEIESVRDGAISSISTDKATALSDIATSKTAALSAIGAEKTSSLSAITSKEATAKASIEALAEGITDGIEDAKTSGIGAVNSAAADKLADIDSAKSSALSSLDTKTGALKSSLDTYTGTKKSDLDSYTSTKKAEITSTTSGVVSQVTSEGTKQKGIVQSAASEGVSSVNSTRDGAIESVQAKGTEQIDAVGSAGTEEVERVQRVYQSDLSAISAECAERANDINDRLNWHDFRKVDRDTLFVLDGDGEKNLKQMMDSVEAYPHDAIMLSLEPIIPTPSTHNFGIRGQIACDDTYLYVCTAENTWKKIPLNNL